MLTWWGIMLDVVDTPYGGGVLCKCGGVLCLMWWIRHMEAGYMLTWWGILLDVVDTPYGGGVLC